MNETEPSPGQNNESAETGPELLFERYPDLERIVEVMEEGEIVEVSDIDDYYQDNLGKSLPNHRNEAYWAKLHHKTLSFRVTFADQDIQAIFKPREGEDMESEKREWNVDDFYIREVACYEIDRALGFGLVPPTIVRDQINYDQEKVGIGSLRLFIPSGEAETHTFNDFYGDHMSEFTDTLDWKAIAVFDYLTANADRHMENLLFSQQKPFEVYPIDNALCLKHGFVQPQDAVPRGPRRTLGFREENGILKRTNQPIPEEIMERITSLNEDQAKKDQLKARLEEIGLSDDDVDSFFVRLDRMAEAGTYL